MNKSPEESFKVDRLSPVPAICIAEVIRIACFMYSPCADSVQVIAAFELNFGPRAMTHTQETKILVVMIVRAGPTCLFKGVPKIR